MDTTQLPIIAGLISTTLFVLSNFPVLFRAFQTKDLSSYSFTHILLSNIGNLTYWVYIVSLPFGPVWLLHGFFTITTALMLGGYLYFQQRQLRSAPAVLALTASA